MRVGQMVEYRVAESEAGAAATIRHLTRLLLRALFVASRVQADYTRSVWSAPRWARLHAMSRSSAWRGVLCNGCR